MPPKLTLARIIDLICQKHFLDQLRDDPNFCFTPVVIGAENPQCKTPEVQKLVAEFTLILSVVVGLLSAITAPKLGELSDRYGRKGLIIFSSTGGIANEIITILAARFPASVPYQILIVGSIFDGLGGSFTAGSVLSHSYASDCTPPSKRGVAMGYLHACLFSGFALGPLLAGYFVELTGTLVSVFYVTLACHIIFILFIFFITPESLSMKRQLLAREKHDEEQMMLQHSGWYSRLMGGKTNPLAPLRILVPPGREKAPIRRNLVTLAICDFVILGSAMASSSIVLLYSELVFGWTNLETNQFVSFLASIRVFVLMAIFPLITWCFRTRPMQKARAKVLAAEQQSLGGSGSAWNQDESPEHHAAALQPETNSGADSLDIWLLRVSVLSDMLGALGYVLVRTPALFVLSGAVTAFGGIATATIQASATKHVPPQMVGQLLGAIGLLHAIGRIFTPVLFNGLYAATVKTFPQAFFVLLLGCFAFAFVSSWFVRPNSEYFPYSIDLLEVKTHLRECSFHAGIHPRR